MGQVHRETIGLCAKKNESSLELARSVLVKANDPFLRIRKKISRTLSLDVRTAVIIAKEEAPALKKEASSRNGGKMVLRRRAQQ